MLLEIFLSQGYKKKENKNRDRSLLKKTKEDLNYSVGLCHFEARDIVF